LRILIAGVATSLALLGVVGSYDLARADGETNTLSTTNGPRDPANVLHLPTVASAPEDTNEETAADATEDASKTSPPPAAASAPPPVPPMPGPQTPPPMPLPRVQPQPGRPVATAQVPPQQMPPPPAPSPAPASPPAEVANIDFEFQAAPINALLEWYSRLTNRSIISAPNLQASITFRSQTKLTKDEAIQALDSVLAINNIAAIPLGEKFLKIVTINTAKLEGVPVGRISSPADTLGTQIIPLKNAKASDVVPLLQPYLHPYGQLLALQDSNSILITETAGNLKQMMEIITYVDQPSTLRMEMRSYVMAHAKAGDVMQRLQTILQEAEQAGAHAAAPGNPAGQPPTAAVRRNIPQPGQPAGTPGANDESVVEGKVIMAADDRTNKIFILTRPSNFGFFDRLIAELDAKVEPDVVMKVIELNYATAEDISSLINGLITGASVSPTSRRTTSSSGTTTSGARAPAIPPPPVSGGNSGGGVPNTGLLQYAEGVRIIPDPRTNCLIVMATKEDMLRIEELVRSIDTPVAQVQIEVVIAEVDLDNELDVGVDVFKRLFEYGQTSQIGGSSTDGNTPTDLTSSSLATNVAAGAFAPGLTYFTTFRNLKLDMVVHALSKTSKSKVLSTPIILTMDNQEADIISGESVPVPVSTVSSLVSGTGTLATGQLNANIEYKDVAIELKVTPRINPDGYVRMDIEQKVNDLGAATVVSGTAVPTINKREAKSSVAVQDQSTIMLGGLIKENKSKTETKVPFLGDVPLLGHLFRGQTNTKTRNELIIFIRPTVLRTDNEALAEARKRTKMLSTRDEMDLDRFFPKEVETNGSVRARHSTVSTNRTTVINPTTSETSPVPNLVVPSDNTVPPPSPVPSPTTSAVPPTDENPADRQSAKVKALKLQDGDMIAQ